MYCESCRESFEFVFDAIPGIVWEADPATLRFTFVSDAAEQLLGYARGDWFADGFWFNHIYPADRDAALTTRRNATAEGQNFKSVYRMIAADGRSVWLRDSFSLEVREGGTVRLRGVMIDVSEPKRLEERLVHAQRTAYAGTLALGAAHDFTNVLTIVLGCSDLLLARVGPEDPSRRDIEAIRDASKKAIALARRLITMGRRGRSTLTNLDLRAVVEDTVVLLERVVGKHIKVVTRMLSEVGSIRADLVQIEQVIFNLVINARDAMPEGGRVTVETFSASGKTFLSVSDTGRGMDAETVARAFEWGFTTKPHGSGIGLATVRSIVNDAGGEISIQSQPGAGTTVRIGFPTTAALPAARNRETILLVEDNDLVRDVIAKMLRQDGYQVVETSSGDEALQVLRNRETPPVDLLMTELLLPGLGGIALADQILKENPQLRVLFMSGYASQEFIHFQRPLLRSSFIQKPFDSQELADQLRQMLDSGQ